MVPLWLGHASHLRTFNYVFNSYLWISSVIQIILVVRNMKKAFYASAFIFETLKVFGEVLDEVCHDNSNFSIITNYSNVVTNYRYPH